MSNNSKEYNHEYYIQNRNKLLVRHNKYNKEHPEIIKKCKQKFYEEHPDYYNEYHQQKRKKDAKFKINLNMTCAIWKLLKGNKNGNRWEDLVGYTVKDLIKHLKKTIPDGYIWNDYLEGKLHIDHIIPISVFNFSSLEHPDFKRCWALENLRLLPAKENLQKSNKLEKSFQPALKLVLKNKGEENEKRILRTSKIYHLS